MLAEELKEYTIILASQSPRRQYLLKELGLNFRVEVNNIVKETYPSTLTKERVPVYLAELKAKAFDLQNYKNPLLITADTIVLYENDILNKPVDYQDAIRILKKLSGNVHHVITGVCLRSYTKNMSFSSTSKVFFKELTEKEIDFYISTYKPYDKAGAYGIQEWIGYIGIEKIEGSFYNVMGLPVQKLYTELCRF